MSMILRNLKAMRVSRMEGDRRAKYRVKGQGATIYLCERDYIICLSLPNREYFIKVQEKHLAT